MKPRIPTVVVYGYIHGGVLHGWEEATRKNKKKKRNTFFWNKMKRFRRHNQLLLTT
jgi:hypothetical protein